MQMRTKLFCNGDYQKVINGSFLSLLVLYLVKEFYIVNKYFLHQINLFLFA